ncbi:MAG: hypothetical protein ACXV5H_07130 [Halobacteriota archaeon]
MKIQRHIIVLIVITMMLASVWIAGCSASTAPNPSSEARSTPTTYVSPSSTLSPRASTDKSAYITSYMKRQGFSIVEPFKKDTSASENANAYSGVVKGSIKTYVAAVDVVDDTTAVTGLFNQYIGSAENQGYTTYKTTSDTWSGYKGDTIYLITMDQREGFVVSLMTIAGST